MIGQISKRRNPTGVRYRHSSVRTCLVIHVKDVIQKRKYKRPCVLGRHHQFLQHSFLHWSILSATICQVSVVLILQLSPKATEMRTSWLTNWQVKQILDVLSRTSRKPYRPRSNFLKTCSFRNTWPNELILHTTKWVLKHMWNEVRKRQCIVTCLFIYYRTDKNGTYCKMYFIFYYAMKQPPEKI